ncbi:DEAD/DEAH box helicase family protein [Clostridium perfringens]|nr:DEAD/DEAH box helicase family protein [Clostridium perfringens]
MNAKERFYSGMAKETINRITANKDNWTSFLTTMARNYEFTYPEQVMIYAQRPGATFCKPYEEWNDEKYRRYVRRGSTGIALFVTNRDKPYLRYVFDVADTGTRRSSPELKPWEVTNKNRAYVMDTMERTFGVKADGLLEAQLEEIAQGLASEYWADNRKQFLDIVANSFLEEYDELNIEVAFKTAVANSVSYVMYSRLVDNPDNYFEHEDFLKVFDFNSRQTVNALGTAVNAISSRMFREIEKAIDEYEQSRTAERSEHDERNDLQTDGRLSDPQHGTGEPERQSSGQVWQDAQSISGAEQSDAPERHDSDGEPVPASVGDRGHSEVQSGTADGSVSGEEPGTGQSDKSDGVGAAHEQPESTSRGSRDDGAYQQLSLNLFLSESEQISFIDQAESFKPSAFSFAQEEIDHFLLLGSNTDEARKIIALEYMKQKPVEEIAQALKEVYHGGFGIKEDSGNISALYAEDGIHLAKGSSAIDSPRAQIIPWEDAATRIGELLENGQFATNVELVEAPGYERQKLAQSIWYLYHDLSDEAREGNYLAILHQDKFRGFPDETAALAEKLADPQFQSILVQQYAEFREALAENKNLLRFRYHKLDSIGKRINELDTPLREFQTDMMYPPLVRQFITDDEINKDLTRGSGFAGGKARIYGYWQENHSTKEKADFLKNEFGTGGHSHACSGASHSGQDHDAKGVRYQKSGCDNVQMSWTQVAQRIDSLMQKGRYLTPEEEAERQAIEVAKADPLEDVNERFAVVDTEDGEYAIWDEQTSAYYVDPEGVTEYFDDEWLANDYLEEVRQSVAAMEAVQPEAPAAEPDEVVEDPAQEEPSWNYQVGDTVYLDDTAFRVEQITDREVQLRDPTLAYPIFRAENRENFERMLSQDERNHAVRVDAQAEEKPVTEPIQGENTPETAQPERRYLVAAYHHFENGFDDKLDYYTLEEAEKAAQGYVDGTMEDDGFKYDGAAVYDQHEHKCIRIYGDYPDEKAHAQVYGIAEPVQPDHFIDHFYVSEDVQKRGALDIKEYSTFEDALRAYHELPDTQRKALGVMNTRKPLPGSLDFVQCVDGKDTIIQDYTKIDGWQNAEVMDIVAQIEQSITTRVVPPVPAVNYHITDDHIGEGGPKQKFARNIEAIETLFKLESEDRNATPEEQEILSNYVGWGGLADAFDPDKGNWAQEYATLKNLLSEDEYAAARASTLNAHYTSPTVIRSIYDAVGQMGFETGNILEPAMGIGNFFGMLPPEMQSSRLYGVELDSITGRIAQKLYPNAEIKVAGFETTDRRDFYDLAVGNVPFGNYKVSDKPYDKLGFSIHNYFFAKALDQVRPGGVVAFVTSRYTMDSKNSDARRYMAQRAELLGAIRLPNDAFKKNAGTEVVSDILFLQKRDHPIDIVPDWVHLNRTEEGHTMNSYFVDHPEMVLGDTVEESTAYGMDITVHPIEGVELSDLLKEAVSHIKGTYQAVELPEAEKGKEADTIPATPDVKNFSYAVVDGEVYFRENSIMRHLDLNEKAKDRVMGMVELRGIVNELIEYQLEDFPDEMISQKQAELNEAYDAFTAKHGLINNRANGQAFSDDSSYYLLCSLENVDEDGNLKSKADMFTKRTIKPERRVTSVDTPSEALAISIGERGKVDLPFMAQLLGTPDEYDAIKTELRGVIFKDPMGPNDPEAGWQTADEYLSGDVRSKLRIAEMSAKHDPSFNINVEALQKAQPKDLDASEIDVRLGATWIDADYIQQFMEETFETPYYLRRSIEVKFSEMTAEWRINGKSSPSYNDVAAYVTYGTDRANAYRILEETLNLKDIRIYDTIEDPDGKQKRVLNKKETTLAQQKQQAIKDAFQDWVWKDPRRREALVTKYNELFNSTRPREYDGSHIRFGGMNPDITLREHQRNAIAHVLYGGNTLLAHEVGAGKTFEMAASAMESKRLGLSQKSMFVVPNHLTLQWANEFLHLYPSAKLLVATKKDFETANRKKFCARIATGDYDAVIIGHSQFEKIPLSPERQERQLREQIDEIEGAIAELKWQRGENFTIKQMEKTRKSLEARLDKLIAADKKDDVITFEQLGVDRLFVDESHAFKNLFLYTKMRNVAGLSTSEAQKSSDMFMKCRYMDEITGGRGVIFATGTPVSNSMTELYTVMRYLQYGTLQKKNLTHFDSWASTFGETTTAIELAPEGTGYRARTRFAKFFNLPELMNMFKEVADIKTSDQLNLPVPEAKFETVVVQPSEHQQDMVAELSERAAAVHAGIVDPSEDNMLKITSDGRKLGLDQRLMNPLLPDDPDSKLNACVGNVLRIWQDGQADKLTQLVFCDLSTPKNDGTFNVYDDIKTKLIANGVPVEEIAFIHDADTEAKKKDLFAKVRTGQVRVLLGSTQKMGAGTNVQDKLVAVHHLDVGWRPSDMTQRNGRIIRQGNQNKEVQVYQYVTEGTFDAYLYQTLENKQKFISQIMTSKSPVRSCDDVDEQALSYAEIKALCAGNPLIKEKMDLDIDVARLKVLKADHQSQQYRMEDKLLKYFPAEIEKQTGYIHGFEADIKTVEAHPQISEGFCGMDIRGKHYAEKADAGEWILAACKEVKGSDPVPLGSYRGFQMELSFDSFRHEYDITLKGSMSHRVALGTDARGNITRLDNALAGITERLERANEQLTNLYNQQEATKGELGKPFPQEAELMAKSQRLAELDAALNMEDTVESRAEKKSTERPSVLADLKSKAEHIPPAKRSEAHEEVL